MPKKKPPARRRVLAELAGHRSIGTTALRVRFEIIRHDFLMLRAVG